MKKSYLLLLVLLSLFILAGNADAKKKSPEEEVVPYITPLPSLCEAIGKISAIKCKNTPMIKNLGCDDFLPPPQDWGELKPYLPMAICVLKSDPAGEAVRQTGCATPMREQYIVLVEKKKKNELVRLKTKEEFRRFFAPIQDGAEAVSYIMALTDTFPIYKFPKNYYVNSLDENGKYTTKKLKTTEVEEKKDGYHVRLFSSPKCGCHRPVLKEVNFIVTKDGYIKQTKEKVIWEAHRLYKICID